MDNRIPVLFGAPLLLLTLKPTKYRKMNSIEKFLADETGLELSEYAVAAAIVTLVAVVAFTDIGIAIAAKIVDLKGKVKP